MFENSNHNPLIDPRSNFLHSGVRVKFSVLAGNHLCSRRKDSAIPCIDWCELKDWQITRKATLPRGESAPPFIIIVPICEHNDTISTHTGKKSLCGMEQVLFKDFARESNRNRNYVFGLRDDCILWHKRFLLLCRLAVNA